MKHIITYTLQVQRFYYVSLTYINFLSHINIRAELYWAGRVNLSQTYCQNRKQFITYLYRQMHLHIYIYIYICVCVCVCVCLQGVSKCTPGLQKIIIGKP